MTDGRTGLACLFLVALNAQVFDRDVRAATCAWCRTFGPCCHCSGDGDVRELILTLGTYICALSSESIEEKILQGKQNCNIWFARRSCVLLYKIWRMAAEHQRASA